MKKIIYIPLIIVVFILGIVACGKEKSPAPTDPCSGVTLTVTATKTTTTGASANGTLTITSPIGAGFTYSLNGGTFAASTSFTNLAAGNYTLTAKNSNGCTGTAATYTIVSDLCAGKTLTLASTTITDATPCTSNDGSVTVTAGGSTGFTYNINNGAFQSSATFNNLATGNYNVIAKDLDGCTKTATFTVGAKPAGPLFAAVRVIIQNNCVSCHGSSSPSGGVSLATDCDIVNRWDRINARAVLGNPSFMPQSGPLPATERAKITNWVNAGHLYTN